jgi:hypothetical protein
VSEIIQNADDPQGVNDVATWVVELAKVDADREMFDEDVPACSSAFLNRVQEAALLTAELAKYRGWALREGFVPVSFVTYLRRIEELAGLAFDKLLMHFGVTQLNPVDAHSLVGIGRLWKALGFSWREARANLRISLLPVDQLLLGPSIRMRTPSGNTDSIEAYEMALRRAESAQDPNFHEKLRDLEALLGWAYKSGSE